MSLSFVSQPTNLHVQNEPHLKLLSYQHNQLRSLQRLDNLPSLVFLDAYANSISSVPGVSALTGLRILMLGRNQLPDLSGALFMFVSFVETYAQQRSGICLRLRALTSFIDTSLHSHALQCGVTLLVGIKACTVANSI